MSRDKKLHDLQMLVLAYMRSENIQKAREALEKWEVEVKAVRDEQS